MPFCNLFYSLMRPARAGDMDATMKFYEKHFGLKQTRYRDIPDVCALLCISYKNYSNPKLCSGLLPAKLH